MGLKAEKPGEVTLSISKFEMPKEKLGLGVSYTFDIRDNTGEKAGEISLRLGESLELYYLGHIGYHVDEPFRGQNYAYKACLKLIPLINSLKVTSLVITTDEHNLPSRRVCEKLGAILERRVTVPKSVQEKYIMDEIKLRYIWMTPYEENHV